MIKLPQSLNKWLEDNYKDFLPLIKYGHLELFSEEMEKEYLEWCDTEEGRGYLKGGSNYIMEE